MSDKFDGLYNIRLATDADRNFILKTFLLGIYYGDTWFSKIPKRIFMDNYKRIAEALFNKYRNNIRIACLPDEQDVILGYSILNSDSTVLQFVYVKERWRRKGVGRQLVPPSVCCVTHLTSLGETLIKKLKPEPLFNPFNFSP